MTTFNKGDKVVSNYTRVEYIIENASVDGRGYVLVKTVNDGFWDVVKAAALAKLPELFTIKVGRPDGGDTYFDHSRAEWTVRSHGSWDDDFWKDKQRCIKVAL